MAETARRDEARQGRQDAETETEEGDGGAGYPPAHFTGAVEPTTESDARQRREYGK